MRRYSLVAAMVAGALLGIFVIVGVVGVNVLVDPGDALAGGGVAVAAVAVTLLVVDVVLPVPSSVVMLALGAAYGVVAGAVLATIGSVVAAAIVFAIGRHSERWLDRFVSPDDRSDFASWFERRGVVAIIVSRPLPIVAETVAGLAGTTSMSARRFVAVAAAGTMPVAIAYAATGAAIADIDDPAHVVGGVAVVAGLGWFAGRQLRRSERLAATAGPTTEDA